MVETLTIVGWGIGILLFAGIIVIALWRLRRKFRKLLDNIPDDLQGGDSNGTKQEGREGREGGEGGEGREGREGGEGGEGREGREDGWVRAGESGFKESSESISDGDDSGEQEELPVSRDESTSGDKARPKKRKRIIRRFRN